MKTLPKELICLYAFMMSQSNAINSSFASDPGWKVSVNSMKVDYPAFCLPQIQINTLLPRSA